MKLTETGTLLAGIALLTFFGVSNPAQARYTEVDPMGLAAGPNLYAYAKQNPTQNVDPTGLAPGDIYTATPAGLLNGGLNTFVQSTFFGQTGPKYSHAVLEISPDRVTGARMVMQSNPGTGVVITTMEEFAEYELGRGSSIDRYTPTIPLTQEDLHRSGVQFKWYALQ